MSSFSKESRTQTVRVTCLSSVAGTETRSSGATGNFIRRRYKKSPLVLKKTSCRQIRTRVVLGNRREHSKAQLPRRRPIHPEQVLCASGRVNALEKIAGISLVANKLQKKVHPPHYGIQDFLPCFDGSHFNPILPLTHWSSCWSSVTTGSPLP